MKQRLNLSQCFFRVIVSYWVESLTALVEHHDGRFEVLSYTDFCQRLEEKEQRRMDQSQVIVDSPSKTMIENEEPGPVEEDPLPDS